MTREEQIIKASQLYAKHQQKPFMDGARWADANPDLYSVTRKAVERERKYLINKACEWLEENMEDYTRFYEDYDVHDVVASDYAIKKEFIEAFKKAMEEQQ